MKVVKFLSVALVSSVLFVSGVNAVENKGGADVNAENLIRNELASALSVVSASESETVNIVFAITGKGFELKNVTGKNDYLVKKVKAILASKNISSPESLNGQYMIKIRFVDAASL